MTITEDHLIKLAEAVAPFGDEIQIKCSNIPIEDIIELSNSFTVISVGTSPGTIDTLSVLFAGITTHFVR